MASKPKTTPQDLPPPGGYKPIQINRINIRRFINPKTAFVWTVASLIAGITKYHFDYKHMLREEVELRSAQLALYPLLLAERDRNMLRQHRKNRDEEAELMQDYPGWEVGTYFGAPIYNWTNERNFVEQCPDEYWAHTNPMENERFFRAAYL